MSENTPYEGWAILELMGHRKLAGYLSEQAIGGASFVRIDVPSAIDPLTLTIAATQFYSPAAVYCITPTTEDLARKLAVGNQPAPVTRWELRPADRPVMSTAPGGGRDFTDFDDGEGA